MERIDDLQRGGLKIIQDTELFCFGTDAVLLADFARVPGRAKVVDFGTGTGILPLLLYARQPSAHYTALEVQPALYNLACRSVTMNGLGACIRVVRGDILQARQLLGSNYDMVVANPPYEKVRDGASRESQSHRLARKEVCITLRGLCENAAAVLRYGGGFAMIHKAARLAEAIYELKSCRLEPKRMRMVHATIADEPKYVLLGAIKGAREHLRVEPPLVLYGENGEKTPEHRRIYGEENT